MRRKEGQRRAGDYQTSDKEEKKTDKTLVQGELGIERRGNGATHRRDGPTQTRQGQETKVRSSHSRTQ